jgi:hypothetical protein
VPAGAADDHVAHAVARIQEVVVVPAHERVLALVPEEPVVPALPAEGVGSRAAADRVNPRPPSISSSFAPPVTVSFPGPA